ncbi:toxin Doc, partial [Streptomyces sp. NPDC059003]
MPSEHLIDHRWLLERQAEILPDDVSVNDFSVLVGMAARHKVDPPRHDKDSDAWWRAAVLLEECVLLRPLPSRNELFGY